MARKPKIETSVDLDEERGGSLGIEILKTVGIFLLAIVFFRFYVFQPFLVRGTSMEPNFHDGQYLVVNELSYNLGNPKRGDAVVFKHPEPACTEFVEASYINQVFLPGPCVNYIKRVIGLPGETVSVKDGKVYIKNEDNPQGIQLKEDYIQNMPTLGSQTVTLGKKEYYVLGDNRFPNASSDSREWGVLEKKYITGKASLILYPFDDLEAVKRPAYNE